MTPEDILSHPAKVLTSAQRRFFFDEGYLFLEGAIRGKELEALQRGTQDMIEDSRSVAASNDKYVLEPGHSQDAPRLRRLNCACDHHPEFWAYASQAALPDIVSDVVGPDVKFREGMINFKWAGGGDEVKWHQDIPFYPHTNLTPLITLTFLDDVLPDMGPLMVIPGSHKKEIFDHHDQTGRWAGSISNDDLKKVALDKAVTLTGPAGSIAVIHGCLVHGSQRNESERGRPLLIIGYSSADAFCYTALGTVSKYTWQIVRGQPAKYSHHDPVRLRIPPDWSRGYTSIFEDQKKEARSSQYGS